MIATDSYKIFRKDEWFSLFAKHFECMVFIGMLLGTHLLSIDCQEKQMMIIWLDWLIRWLKVN